MPNQKHFIACIEMPVKLDKVCQSICGRELHFEQFVMYENGGTRQKPPLLPEQKHEGIWNDSRQVGKWK